MMQNAVPVLRTPRLTLRPLVPDDAPALVAGVGNFDVSKWLAVVPYPYGLDNARDFIAQVTQGAKPIWGIDDGTGVVGVVGLDDQLGYWLARPAWGRGYAFEATERIVGHFFDDAGNDRLTSNWFDGNLRSAHILAALGFREIGTADIPARALSQTVTAHVMQLSRADWEVRQRFELFSPRLSIRRAAVSVGSADGPGAGRFTVFLRDTAVGAISVAGHPPALRVDIDAAFRRRGLATEALSVFLPEWFARTPAQSLRADGPVPIGRFLARFGFAAEGGGPDGTPHFRLRRDDMKVPL